MVSWWIEEQWWVLLLDLRSVRRSKGGGEKDRTGVNFGCAFSSFCPLYCE